MNTIRSTRAIGVTRRSAMVAGVAAGGAALAAACGATEPEGGTARSAAPVTLAYMAAGNTERMRRLATAYDQFTSEHPNVKVEINSLPEGQTWDVAMLVRHQAGDAVDTVEMVTYWHHLHPAGVP